MDQLLAMRAFQQVVEAGNFTKASASLRMPKATVSKLVASLEAHLGAALLVRTTRRVAVTPEGERYYEQSARIVKELADIDGCLAAAATPTGRLRVNLGSSIATSILVPALSSFLAQYPDIRVDLGVSDREVDLVAENVDCVIRGGAMADTGLIARKLAPAAWVTCATPAYLKQFGTPKRVSDLQRGHRIVNYVSARSGRILPMRFMEKSGATELSLPHAVGINESNAHFVAGLAGVGIVQTFAFLAAEAVKSGALVPILTKQQPKPYPLHLAYAPSRHPSSRLRAFVDWAVEVFQERLAG